MPPAERRGRLQIIAISGVSIELVLGTLEAILLP
jgi:hypothetical protein